MVTKNAGEGFQISYMGKDTFCFYFFFLLQKIYISMK